MASTPTPAMAGRSNAQYFLEEHDQLLSENEALRYDLSTVRHDNQVLLSEVNMLREELSRADKDRMMLHGFFRGLVAKKEMADAGMKMLDMAFKEAAQLGLDSFRQAHYPSEPNRVESPIEEPSKVILSTSLPEIEEQLRNSLREAIPDSFKGKIPPVSFQ